jgi:hypothetical protein
MERVIFTQFKARETNDPRLFDFPVDGWCKASYTTRRHEMHNKSANHSDLIFYQSEDGLTRLEVRLVNESVWLSLNQMADLFQRDKSVISRHITNVFDEGELKQKPSVANFATVQKEGTREVFREIECYNLDVIISVGYRVKSLAGTQFRIWATQRLREFIVKGFTLDDERLKQGGSSYFDELLARIRDIRASEKNFYQKIKDIYATSADYDENSEISQDFFAMAQNKLHWAIHGHTAAEVIAERVNAAKPNMGLTSWSGSKLRKQDVHVAKNYLNQEEISLLNLIVTQYLDFAEFQARTRKAMYMRDWVKKLDDFLRLNDREVLRDLGKISSQIAKEKADREYDKFQEQQRALADSKAAEELAATLKDLENQKKPFPRRKPKS